MQHSVGIERKTIGDNLLLRLAVRKRAHVLVDLCRCFSCAAIRTDAIDNTAATAADEKISLPVKRDAIRSRRARRIGLRQPRLRRVEVSTANAHHFAERPDRHEKVTLRIERDARWIGVDLLAIDFPRLDSSYDNRLRRRGIDAQNISSHPVGKIKHAAAICGDALHDHRALRTRRIEVNQYRDLWTAHWRGRTTAQ